jgi:hypothetical protein
VGGSVLGVENLSPPEQDKPLFHDNPFLVMNRISVREQRVNALQASFRKVLSNCGEYSRTRHFTHTFTDSGQFATPNFLPHSRLELVPVVGLEPTRRL